MIFAALICISVLILIVCWYFYRQNIELFMCILIALNFEFFYLAPRIRGPDDYKLLLLPMVFTLFADGIFRGTIKMGRYGWWIISFLGLSVCSVIVAAFYGQSLELGIKAAKFVPFMLFYFILTGREIDLDRFERYFIYMAIGVATCSTVQYLMPTKNFIFLNMPEYMKTARLENPRVTIGELVISAATVVAFAKYNRGANGLFLVASVILFLEILLVQKTRALIAGVFLSMLLIYVLSKKLTAFRLSSYFFIAGTIMITYFAFGTEIYNVELVKRTGSDIVHQRGSYQARVNAYMYYWKEIEKRPILGSGLLNFNWQGNNEKYLQREKGIHLIDIGITHFIVQAGIIGFIWLIYGLCKIWIDIYRNINSIAILSYFVLATFILPTIDMFLRIDSMILCAIFLGLFSAIYCHRKPMFQ